MSSPVKVRFAPSPTGFLHVGNLRTAVINWLFAKKQGGHFMLRMDDTDHARSEKRFEEGIIADLTWLGMPHDSFARQSERGAAYDAALDKLITSGRLYPCYETPEELDLKRKAQLNQGRPPLYDRAALRLTPEDRVRLEADGKVPHWRFFLTPDPVVWDDLFRGSVRFLGSDLSDPVLRRADGSQVYTLSSVVDDLEFGITHIIRGEDHVANTAVQIQLMEALGGDVSRVTFGHFPWIVDAEGHGLSKRLGSMGVKELHEAGIEPLALQSFLTHLGTSEPITPHYSREELEVAFDISTFSRTPPKFLLEELVGLNTKWLHHAPLEVVTLEGPIPEAFWQVVKGNITTAHEALSWWRVCTEQLEALPVMHAGDKPVIDAALKTAPDEELDQPRCTAWCQAVAAEAGVKGPALWMPLRRALTGHDHGPNLAALMAFMGRARCLERLTIASNCEG